MNKFDSIRPYTDNEVNDVLLDLSNNRRFLKMLFANGEYSYLRLLPFSRKILGFILRNKVKSIHDVQSYQNFFESIVNSVVENSIKNFTVNGIENLNPNTGYLFVSNHRDITLDSALLNLILHKNNLGTTNNAVGNNLLSEKWASDLMRLNKSFIIDRSDKSKREIYQSLNLASEFIWDSISNKNESVWIAQKQGRSKDGNDFTDPSVIKMIHLNARKKMSVDKYLNSLKVVPVSISYEKDPNDITKATELYLTDLNSEYIKDSKEDLKSISDGIRGHKGDVNLNIGEVMHFNNDSYDDCSEKITETIKQSYKNHATNYAAAILQGKNFAANEFTNEEIDDAITYLNKRMEQISGDVEPYFLQQYSNSVIS